MRLNPIDKPKGSAMRVAFWMTQRQFGKVLTPMRVLYPRMPGGMKLAYEMQKFENGGLHLDPELHFMVGSLVSEINGCSFCVDIARAMAIRKHMGLEKFNDLVAYRSSSLYSDRERAALRYVEEATRHKRVSDATFASLRQHFSENEIVELTWLNAVHNYYNLINLPLVIESDGLCAIAQNQMATPKTISISYKTRLTPLVMPVQPNPRRYHWRKSIWIVVKYRCVIRVVVALRPSCGEARANGAGVGYSRLVESADRSTETGLRHVAEGTGLIPPHREFLVIEDYFPKQNDFLKTIQGCRSSLVKRFSLNSIDLLFDSLDFPASGGGNPLPIVWAVSLSAEKCRRSRD